MDSKIIYTEKINIVEKNTSKPYFMIQYENNPHDGLFSIVVRAPGIEPGPNPWQGLVLPLNHARPVVDFDIKNLYKIYLF